MHKMARTVAALSLFLASAALTIPAFAQSLTGSISGVVRDEQQAVLPGVTVTLTGRMGKQTQVTDKDGSYRFPAVEVGVYELAAELAGFQVARQRDIQVSPGRQLTADLVLSIRGVTDTVTVRSESPVVDVRSSATETTISQSLLYSAPITRTAINVLNYAPGINSSSAYGGEAGSANSLLIDGVDTRDPSGGTAWTFYNYNIVEEMQFQGLGAPAEYGGFTGAVVNTITKSGGNRFSGLFEVLGTNSSFASSNATGTITEANPALARPGKTTRYIDVTGQLGGPIKQNELFFFGSAQRFLLEQDPTGPRTISKEVSPRINTKLTWQKGASDNITAHYQYDAYNIIGRAGVSALAATDELTNREDAPEHVALLQWRHLFSSNTFSEVKFTGYTGFFDLNPEVPTSGRFDLGTGLSSVSQGWFYYADRERQQVNASVSHYANKFGAHEFKFGAEFERSKTRDRYGYTDGFFYFDYYGVPYYAYSYGYDITASNRRQSAFAQDSWKIADRLTLNIGLRGDFIQGTHPELGKVFDTKSWGPRLGFAWDVAANHNTVLKGSYGQYYEGAQTQAFTRALPGIEDYVGYSLNSNGSIGEEFSRDVNVPYAIADDLKHPRVDEATLGLERALFGNMRLSVTGILRDSKNFIGSVNPSARWSPVQLTNPLTSQPIALYRWDNRAQSDTDFVIQNVEGFQFRTPNGDILGTLDPERRYRAVMFVLSKRQSNRWQAQASYVLSKATGNVDNTSGQQISSSIFESPVRSLVNTEGSLTNDRRHEFKLLGSYQIPFIEVSVNTFFRVMSGRNYAPFGQFSNTQLNAPTAARRPLLEPRGARRLPQDLTLDMRFEKVFRLGGRDQVGLFADVTNMTNRSTITSYLTRVPSTAVTVAPGESVDLPFEAPGAIVSPRQAQFGLRWSF